MHTHSRYILTAVALFSTACLPPSRRTPESASLEAARLERLYFGRSIGDTAVVSDSAWSAFVRDVLTPQFPEGATMWSASGQWRSPSGALVREPSFVVELLRPASAEYDARVQSVIDAYKSRFAQQAVLRTVTDVRAAF